LRRRLFLLGKMIHPLFLKVLYHIGAFGVEDGVLLRLHAHVALAMDLPLSLCAGDSCTKSLIFFLFSSLPLLV
ncbi:hypothetical protein U1Q18_031017, partial [Sarracenia purpurea var. burkii]